MRHVHCAKLPLPHQQHRAHNAQQQNCKRHNPCDAIKALRARRGQNGGAILLHKRLQDQIVVVALVDARNQLIAHALGSRAANVVALQQHLVAAATANHLVTEFIETRTRIGGTHREDHHHGKQSRLDNAQNRFRNARQLSSVAALQRGFRRHARP